MEGFKETLERFGGNEEGKIFCEGCMKQSYKEIGKEPVFVCKELGEYVREQWKLLNFEGWSTFVLKEKLQAIKSKLSARMSSESGVQILR